MDKKLDAPSTLREYDTVARADHYFAEYRKLFSQRRGNERDIFEIFRGSCIDVIESRLRKNVKAPASCRINAVFKKEKYAVGKNVQSA